MIEEQLRVLKVMSEVKRRSDLNEFARMVGLTPNQTVESMQELVKADVLRRIGGGYGITETGKAALKAFTPVPKGMEFHFYIALDQPAGFLAKSFWDFYKTVKLISAGSLEFHLRRGDFEKWTRIALKNPEFADYLTKLQKPELKGEKLRKAIIKAAESVYGIERLR